MLSFFNLLLSASLEATEVPPGKTMEKQSFSGVNVFGIILALFSNDSDNGFGATQIALQSIMSLSGSLSYKPPWRD